MPLSRLQNSGASPASISSSTFGHFEHPTAKELRRQRSDQTANSKGLSKLLSFPWGRDRERSEKKGSSTPLVSPTLISHPVLTNDGGFPRLNESNSALPMGFPLPPPPQAHGTSHSVQTSRALPPSRPLPPHPPTYHRSYSNSPVYDARPHPTTFVAQHASVPSAKSTSTISTHPSLSSFASTSMFSADWDSSSEATSLSLHSSPESGSQGGQTRRMWKVEGFSGSPSRGNGTLPASRRGSEDVEGMVARWRNSTPVPGASSSYLDPATPPRLKRLSDSSSAPCATSPPFDLAFERAARERSYRNGCATPSPPTSPDNSEDADDEVSPPRSNSSKTIAHLLFPSDQVYNPKTRIPSIRFEGISMDAVFAEVEAKMKREGDAETMDKRTKRRTRVLSMYPTYELPNDTSVVQPPLPNPPPSRKAVREEATPNSRPPLNNRPQNVPAPIRKAPSRPAPLDIAAANALPTAQSKPHRVRSPGSSSPAPFTEATSPSHEDGFAPLPSPVGRCSPRLIPTSSLSPRLPSSPLGEAFIPSPVVSPALSSTSTFRGWDLPEVCVRPPTPTSEEEEDDWIVGGGRGRMRQPKVLVLEEKRRVKVSSRPTSFRRSPSHTSTFHDVDIITPPLSPAMSTASTISSNSPTPVNEGFGLFSMSKPFVFGSISTSEDDGTDVQDALSKMLFRLNPPSPTSPERTTASLTASALERHTAAYDDASEDDSDLDPFARARARPLPSLLPESPSLFGSPFSSPLEISCVDSPPTTPETSIPTPSNSYASSIEVDDTESSRSGQRDSMTSESGTESGYDSFGEVGVVLTGERVRIGFAM